VTGVQGKIKVITDNAPVAKERAERTTATAVETVAIAKKLLNAE